MDTDARGIQPRQSKANRRTPLVWVSLIAAMTGVAGVLSALQDAPGHRADGVTLTPLAGRAGAGSIEAVFATRQGLDRDRFRAIMIHHSGSTYGKPSTIEAEHVEQGLRGLGHHFVIGNGSGMDDGEVHVGYRWLDQLPGAHAVGPEAAWYNHRAISICLVGDGDRRPFTDTQMQRLIQLVNALALEMDIPADRIVLHREIAGVSDPGMLFPIAEFREQLANLR